MVALRPYQEEAADFLFSRDRALVLAPVGAGKTALTLAAMRDMLTQRHVKRWLVLAPLRVCRDVWPVEGPKWAPGMEMAVAIGTPAQRKAAFASGAPVVVTNYDNAASMPSLADFDGVVFDELTRLKNPGGKRWKAIAKLIAHVNVRWGLTGSFTSNGLEDVFGQCKIVDEKLLGRAKGAFLQQYFYCINRDFGQWVPAKGALEEVMARIKPVTYLLEPGVYADRLPPLNVVEVECALEDRAPYEKMKHEFVVQFPDAQVVAQNAGTVTTKLQQMAGGFVYHDDDATWFSTHKLNALEEILDGNQRANTIVVYNYREELATLKRLYPQAITIDAPDAVERWNRGEIEMLLIHPKSAGHGLNLQHGGCHIVFLSLPWSLELYEQTVGRLHRGGQTKPVWCYVILCKETIDGRIWGALHNKRAVSDLALEELRA